jgi:hypothetical protein
MNAIEISNLKTFLYLFIIAFTVKIRADAL